MTLFVLDNQFSYELENIVRVFFPLEKITVLCEKTQTDENYAVAKVWEDSGKVRLYCELSIDGKVLSDEKTYDDITSDGKECERLLAENLYGLMCEMTGYTPLWGILTGVRPSKLMIALTDDMGREKAKEYFREKLLVSDEKTALASNVADAEREIISLSGEKSYSLYVSIPFCPTRCSYCSFVSHSIEQAKKLMPDYIRLLCDELGRFSEIANELGLKLETIYFGGGTPTSLCTEDLKTVTDAVSRNFDVKSVREYTIEAGRPDTLTEEKLHIMKNAGVTRISINPQTFNDNVLEAIGRKHTSVQTVEAFKMARKCGFDNINMDLIAGLPLDTVESFSKSVDKAIELNPENITVHTLALKRAAAIVTDGRESTVSHDTAEMLRYSSKKLRAAGYIPYYMYRQSKSVGNLENVGWSKKGKECLYNIYMMEEIHSVFASGGGAVTKLKNQRNGHIDRIFNFKYPYEYITRFEELMQRKTAIKDFYENEKKSEEMKG